MTRRRLRASPGKVAIVLEADGKRQYVREGEVFILESLSDSVVRVTRREQTGFCGIDQNWDPSRPYK